MNTTPPPSEGVPPPPNTEQSAAGVSPEAEQQDSDPMLQRQVSSVGGVPGKTMLVVVGLFLFLILLLYNIFSGEEEEAIVAPQSDGTGGGRDIVATTSPIVVPDRPDDVTINIDPPVPVPPIRNEPEVRITQPAEADINAKAERLRSNIMLYNNTVRRAKQAVTGDPEVEFIGDDPNRAFANASLSRTGAVRAKATFIERPDRLIAQGKMIDVIMESAINTELPGAIRAIVTRDVYAEAGSHVLIPKGTRLIGTYNTGILRGQKRLYIIWQRAILPGGVDVAIASEAVDEMGRGGVEAAYVDNRYLEVFSNAILVSSVVMGVAYATEEVFGAGTRTERRNSDGSSETESSPTTDAARESVQNIGNIMKQLAREALDMRPLAVIPQGTRMKVFVNRDLIFPHKSSRNVKFLP